ITPPSTRSSCGRTKPCWAKYWWTSFMVGVLPFGRQDVCLTPPLCATRGVRHIGYQPGSDPESPALNLRVHPDGDVRERVRLATEPVAQRGVGQQLTGFRLVIVGHQDPCLNRVNGARDGADVAVCDGVRNVCLGEQ